MDISDFINNWVRPEVKGLIQQYTLCCPFKADIKYFLEKRKSKIYGWCIINEYCFDSGKVRHFSVLYLKDSSKITPFEKWTDVLKESPNGNVKPCIWLTRAYVSWK